MRLPDPDQQNLIVSQGAAPVTGAADTSIAQGLNEAGRGVEEFADRRTAFQLATAQSRFLAEQAEVEAEFSQDRNYEDLSDRYEEAMRERMQTLSQGLASNRARRLFEEEQGAAIARGRVRMSAHADNVEADLGRARLAEELESLLESGINGDATTARMNMEDLLAGAMEAGYIDAESAVQADHLWRQRYATVAIGSMPPGQRADAMQQDWAQFIPIEQRIELARGAQTELREVTAVQAVDDFMSRGLTLSEMNSEIRAIEDVDLRRAVEARRDYAVRIQQQEEAVTQGELYEQYGDAVRSGRMLVSQIPNEHRQAMTQAHLNALESLEQTRRGGGRPETDRLVLRNVMTAIESGDYARAELLVLEHSDKLSDQDFEQYYQLAISGRDEESHTIDTFMSTRDIISMISEDNGLNDDASTQLTNELFRWDLEFQEQNNRKPTEREMMTYAEGIAAEHVLIRAGMFNNQSGRLMNRDFNAENVPDYATREILSLYPDQRRFTDVQVQTIHDQVIESLANDGVYDYSQAQYVARLRRMVNSRNGR